ncbi:MAG: phenylalanine--tRNA ligase beta subunit-related protein, partial [Dehalococcoidia bacterium]|nr:phenylalanine--tRNA ligase beta subunit-related protein [Dehalococcoidia bacterium]
MKDIVSLEVLTKFPEYIRGVVIARGVNNSGQNQRLLELLRRGEDNATQDESLQNIKNHPKIANWRQAYSDFGANPNKFYCSIESLGRRARRGDQVPYINTLVALFNYFSLKHMVPSGGDDLDRVDGKLCLTLAKGNEPFTPLNSDVIEYPAPGEVIYVDNNKVMCRRWNWRQGDQTKITPATTNVAINVDCLPPVSKDEAKAITGELADLV